MTAANRPRACTGNMDAKAALVVLANHTVGQHRGRISPSSVLRQGEL